MTALRLFCFDPGQTCGVALLRVPETAPVRIVRAFEIDGTPPAIFEAFRHWNHHGNGRVIMEDWDRNDLTVDPRATVEAIGMVKMLAHEAGVQVVMQRPIFRKGAPDSEAGTPPKLWLPNLKAHDDRRQSLRHGLAHLMFTVRHLPTLELLQPR